MLSSKKNNNKGLTIEIPPPSFVPSKRKTAAAAHKISFSFGRHNTVLITWDPHNNNNKDDVEITVDMNGSMYFGRLPEFFEYKAEIPESNNHNKRDNYDNDNDLVDHHNDEDDIFAKDVFFNTSSTTNFLLSDLSPCLKLTQSANSGGPPLVVLKFTYKKVYKMKIPLSIIIL